MTKRQPDKGAWAASSGPSEIVYVDDLDLEEERWYRQLELVRTDRDGREYVLRDERDVSS